MTATTMREQYSTRSSTAAATTQYVVDFTPKNAPQSYPRTKPRVGKRHQVSIESFPDPRKYQKECHTSTSSGDACGECVWDAKEACASRELGLLEAITPHDRKELALRLFQQNGYRVRGIMGDIVMGSPDHGMDWSPEEKTVFFKRIKAKKEFHDISKKLNRSVGNCLAFYYGCYKQTANYSELKRTVAKQKQKQKQLVSDNSSDTSASSLGECEHCGMVGELIYCDSCERLYHLDCVTPALDKIPEGDWFCHYCEPQKASRQQLPEQLLSSIAILADTTNTLQSSLEGESSQQLSKAKGDALLASDERVCVKGDDVNPRKKQRCTSIAISTDTTNTLSSTLKGESSQQLSKAKGDALLASGERVCVKGDDVNPRIKQRCASIAIFTDTTNTLPSTLEGESSQNLSKKNGDALLASGECVCVKGNDINPRNEQRCACIARKGEAATESGSACELQASTDTSAALSPNSDVENQRHEQNAACDAPTHGRNLTCEKASTGTSAALSPNSNVVSQRHEKHAAGDALTHGRNLTCEKTSTGTSAALSPNSYVESQRHEKHAVGDTPTHGRNWTCKNCNFFNPREKKKCRACKKWRGGKRGSYKQKIGLKLKVEGPRRPRGRPRGKRQRQNPLSEPKENLTPLPTGVEWRSSAPQCGEMCRDIIVDAFDMPRRPFSIIEEQEMIDTEVHGIYDDFSV